jgi:Ca-activated chloride channel family protein
VLCPLTPDADFFRMALRGASPASVGRGGTRIGDGLRQAIKALPPGGSSRMVLLITDGEDMESYPLDAAKEAATAGVRVVAIGFGDEKGSEITITDPVSGARKVMTDREGNVVHTRLDGETLRQIALATQGAYVPAGTAMLDLPSIVSQHIEPLARQGSEETVRRVPVEHYPWFVMAALAAVCAAAWTGMTPRRRDA